MTLDCSDENRTHIVFLPVPIQTLRVLVNICCPFVPFLLNDLEKLHVSRAINSEGRVRGAICAIDVLPSTGDWPGGRKLASYQPTMEVIRVLSGVIPLGRGVQMEDTSLVFRDCAVRIHSDAEDLEDARKEASQAIVTLISSKE